VPRAPLVLAVLLALSACRARCPTPPAAPPSNAGPAARPPRHFGQPLTINGGDAGAGCFADHDTPEEWRIEIPAFGERCDVTYADPDEEPDTEDWLELRLARCGGARCPLPQPGDTYRATLVLTVSGEDDDYAVPVQVQLTVLRHDRPSVVFGVELVSVPAEYAGLQFEITGELSVKLTPAAEHLADPASWQ